MKSRIAYSRFSIVLTAVVFVLLYVGCIVKLHDKPAFFVILSVYVVLIVCSLLYGAAYIEADSETIRLCSVLRSKRLRMRDVESVELFQPTMGAVRIFGSGGFMGYWGIFREGDIGRYYAFYGKASDCFLVRMRNGDKYVLGCEKPEGMVDYISRNMK